jgi:hypothetical protein
LKGKRVLLAHAVWSQIAISANPSLLAGFLYLIGAGHRVRNGTRGDYTEKLAVVVTWMVRGDFDPLKGSAYADIAQVDVMVWRLLLESRKNVVFIGEADPLTCRIPNMDMRTTPQSPGREWRSQIAGIQVKCLLRVGKIDYDSLAVPRAIFPILRGKFRSQYEDDLVFARMKSRDAAMCPVPGLVQHMDIAAADVDKFDPLAIELVSSQSRSDVIHNPWPIRRPYTCISQDMAVARVRNLSFHRFRGDPRPGGFNGSAGGTTQP